MKTQVLCVRSDTLNLLNMVQVHFSSSLPAVVPLYSSSKRKKGEINEMGNFLRRNAFALFIWISL
jgi:hypothetical protein